MQQAETARGSLGRGASPTTRRALGGVLVVLLVAAVAGVVLDRRDPAEFRDRAALPSCGSTTGAAGALPRAPVACFDAAVGGPRGAELRVLTYTPEGDEIVSYYRALPGGGVEVLIDSSADQYGSGGWVRRSCPRPTSLSTLGQCTTIRL